MRDRSMDVPARTIDTFPPLVRLALLALLALWPGPVPPTGAGARYHGGSKRFGGRRLHRALPRRRLT